MRKRSLLVIAALGLAACRKQAQAPDPCEPDSFSDKACEDAVGRGGYYSHGTFVPHVYANPYPFYYNRFGTYVTGGGISRPAPASSYSAPTPGVTRGGFGIFGSGAS